MRDEQQPVQRWPLGAPREAAPRSRDLFVLAAVIGLGAAGALLQHLPTWQRAVFLAASLGGMWRFALVLRARRALRPRGEVAVDAKGVVRRDRKVATRIASFDSPFGLTILANHMRTHALLAFTTPEQTRFLTVRVDVPDDVESAREMMSRATTIPDGETAGPSAEAAMSGPHAAELVRAIERRAASALNRIYLSGSRGEALVLDSTKLQVGGATFDLDAPLEWRGFMFHEAVGQVATIYQATWVRQGATEVVLIAPMPPEVTTLLGNGREMSEGSQRLLVRDLKLMQSLPDAPPARELRVAIERLFMLPLRQALDRAPKAPRAGVPPADRTLSGSV